MPNENVDRSFSLKQRAEDEVINWSNQLFLQAGLAVIRGLNWRERRDYQKENISVAKNEHYQSISDLLETGIKHFQNLHPETTVSWAQNSDHMSLRDMYSLLVQKLSPEDIKYLTASTYNDEVKKQITLETSHWEVILLSRKYQFATDSVSDFFIDKLPSTIKQRLKKAAKHGEYMAAVANPESFIQLVQFIEEKVEQTGQPCSLAEVIPYTLELTDGNLDLALTLLTSFYKQLARGGILKGKNREQWFKQHILDEYSPTMAFNNLDEGLENKRRKISLFEKLAKKFTGENVSATTSYNMNVNLTNQIGKPYHVLDMMSLLSHFSPELITFFVGGEYAQYAIAHGSTKLLADMLVLKELKKIEKYLQSL